MTMRRIDLEKLHKVDARGLKFRSAQATDFQSLVTDPVDVYAKGQLLIAYRPLEKFPRDLVQAARGVRYSSSYRTDGMITTSDVIGFLPRITLRRDYYTACTMSTKQPAVHSVFLKWAMNAANAYREINPKRYARAEMLLSEVREEWRIPGTVFTSGIINKDNPLRYHHDAGNFKEVWSCMYAVASDCRGGHLAIPETGLGFSFESPALIMFDGQSLIHGVTPLEKRSKNAYRYSVVYYGLQQMRHCLPIDEELYRIRMVRVNREVRRAHGGPLKGK